MHPRAREGDGGDAVVDARLAEEHAEFPLLRATVDEKTRSTLAAAVRAAEAIAPTHPHPGVESAAANPVAGPLASVVDRTRDAMRSIVGR